MTQIVAVSAEVPPILAQIAGIAPDIATIAAEVRAGVLHARGQRTGGSLRGESGGQAECEDQGGENGETA
jgi:hypothetical protein